MEPVSNPPAWSTGNSGTQGRPPSPEPTRSSVAAEYRYLLSGLEAVIVEAARRIEAAPGDLLPGITDVTETVVLYTTSARRRVYGWYCADVWHDDRSGQSFAEIVVNADLLHMPAEDIMHTLIHELVHAYAGTMQLRDTSRRGSYHNGVFADLAMKAGLIVDRHQRRGFTTSGLSQLGLRTYGDLIAPLDTLLRLHRDATPDRHAGDGSKSPTHPGASQDTEQATSTYVMAHCGCTNPCGRSVVIRVTRGNWSPDIIWCQRCNQPFVEPATG